MVVCCTWWFGWSIFGVDRFVMLRGFCGYFACVDWLVIALCLLVVFLRCVWWFLVGVRFKLN